MSFPKCRDRFREQDTDAQTQTDRTERDTERIVPNVS